MGAVCSPDLCVRNLLSVNSEGGEEIESEVVVAARRPDLYVRNLLSVNSEGVPEI